MPESWHPRKTEEDVAVARAGVAKYDRGWKYGAGTREHDHSKPGKGGEVLKPEQLFIRRLNVNLPLTTLGDGEEIMLHHPFTAPAGASLKVVEVGVGDASGDTYPNLTLEVYDVGGASVLYTTNSGYSYGVPISSVDVGGKTIVVRVANATGATYDVGAEFDGCIVV